MTNTNKLVYEMQNNFAKWTKGQTPAEEIEKNINKFYEDHAGELSGGGCETYLKNLAFTVSKGLLITTLEMEIKKFDHSISILELAITRELAQFDMVFRLFSVVL